MPRHEGIGELGWILIGALLTIGAATFLLGRYYPHTQQPETTASIPTAPAEICGRDITGEPTWPLSIPASAKRFQFVIPSGGSTEVWNVFFRKAPRWPVETP